jgi:hypothetical protein
MMLIRLVLDSKILIDLVAPESVFAKKLKVKCSGLHKKNFPWLLDPARITIGEPVRKRALDIYNKLNWSTRWREMELLMRECMRPCAALMDPTLAPSMRCEVDATYLGPDANPNEQPEFVLPCREYRSRLPETVVCGPVEWQNTDWHVAAHNKLKAAAKNKESGEQ